MMRKTITRKLTVTTVTSYGIKMEEGVPAIQNYPPVTVYGKVSDKEAAKAVQDELNLDKLPTVGEIVSTEKVYAIPVDVFVANAEEVDKEEPEE